MRGVFLCRVVSDDVLAGFTQLANLACGKRGESKVKATRHGRIAIRERGQADRKFAVRVTEIPRTRTITLWVPLVDSAPQDGIISNALVIAEIAAWLTTSRLIGHDRE